MSLAQQLQRPSPRIEESGTHLEIAPTRAQRRARPKVYAALVAVGGIVAILMSQLLMSIVLADGAYQISDLQKQKRDLVREQNAGQERVEQLSSTQSLILKASALGMVSSGNPVFLDLATGQALGVAGPATGQLVGSGGNLIANSLIGEGEASLDSAAVAASPADDADSAVSGEDTEASEVGPLSTVSSGVAPVVTSPGTIPSPTTR